MKRPGSGRLPCVYATTAPGPTGPVRSVKATLAGRQAGWIRGRPVLVMRDGIPLLARELLGLIDLMSRYRIDGPTGQHLWAASQLGPSA